MKNSSIYLAILAIIISGCSADNYYGDSRAPIIRQDAFYVSNIEELTGVRTNTATTLSQDSAAVNGTQSDSGTVVNEISPYGDSTSALQESDTTGNDDGWSIKRTSSTATLDPNAPMRPSVDETSTNNTAVASSAASAAAGRSVKATEDAVSTATQGSRDTADQAAATDTTDTATETSASANYIKQASAALGKNDLDGAVAYLEEAQRADSTNPKISYDIANIRYHQGKYDEAEAAAGRAVQIGGDSSVMQKSWSIIANSRKSLGDNQGAIIAAEKAASYQ